MSLDAELERVAGLAGARDKSTALVGLLAEQAAIYDGLGSGEAERVRARIFAALAGDELPPAALPFLLEELETGMDPVATAAAAIALRRAPSPVAEAEPLLLKAIARLALADAMLPLRPGRTALQEALVTLAGLPSAGEASRLALRRLKAGGALSPAARDELDRTLATLADRPAAAAPCCGAAAAPSEPAATAAAAGGGPIRLQDQDGAQLDFDAFFRDEPSLLAFFYTRCMNPERCSLTVTKLARLQQRVAARGLAAKLRIAAISYDPDYDLPSRLRKYGAERGFRFDGRNRFFRTEGPLDQVRARFDLGVGYGPSTVNRHRLDLFVLDAGGNPARSFTRRLWDEEDVLDAVATLAG